MNDLYLKEGKMIKPIFTLVTTVVLLFAGTPELSAQKYPDRPINLVIPMAPGDGIDVSGRIMAEKLSEVLKVAIVPLNKPGATATLGTDMVAKAKKDGYTILLTNNASIINAKVLQPEIVTYDVFNDLTPLGLCTLYPTIIVVRSKDSYKSLTELVEYAKKNPGLVRCGTMGVKSVGDFNLELLQALTGVKLTIVPFKGASPTIPALLGGHVDVVSVTLPVYINQMRGGDVKGIVISKNFPEFPDIPTLKQLGYKQDLFEVWTAFFAPAGVPKEATETLVRAIDNVVRDPVVSSKIAHVGMLQEFEPPEKLSARIREEYRLIEESAKKFGMIK